MMPSERGHTPVPHTADSAVDAWAPDAASLFEECAAAMFEITYGPATSGPSSEVEIDVAGGTIEELLVAWLSELLYVAEVQDLWLFSFVVDAVTAGRVAGRAGGRSATGARLHGPPVKAVTYHGLEVVHDGDWRARVIFDV